MVQITKLFLVFSQHLNGDDIFTCKHLICEKISKVSWLDIQLLNSLVQNKILVSCMPYISKILVERDLISANPAILFYSVCHQMMSGLLD
jgi:hypothetical protein